MKKYSAGQRQEKFLKEVFKIVDKNIIIMDQPENDIDNKTINSIIITQLKQWGFHKQIIMVTNNPMLAINSDPQSIILANYKGDIKLDPKFTYTSIKVNKIDKKEIYEILDGDKSFLKNRFDIFGGYDVD